MSQINSDQLFQNHILERVFQAMGAKRIVYDDGALAETIDYSMERTQG